MPKMNMKQRSIFSVDAMRFQLQHPQHHIKTVAFSLLHGLTRIHLSYTVTLWYNNDMNSIFELFSWMRREKSWITRLSEANNPERIFFVAFLIVILGGSLLLSLPIANQVRSASYIDNLFVSFSAVCVTGLTTVTASSQYTLFGKITMIFLMEIGGLGPMTIIAIIYQRNRRHMETTEKKLFAAGSGKSNLYDVPTYIRRIIRFTFIFELIGFILLCIRLIPLYDTWKGMFHALFLSVSAFTNSGFDCFGADSLIGFAGDPLINFAVVFLIITGGLGFMVWFELYELVLSLRNRGNVLRRKRRTLTVHAMFVLRTTVILLASGMLLFFLTELRNPATLAEAPAPAKGFICLFQSVTLRTAGFATVNIGKCTRPTLLIMCIYMLIGGSPGGTAGGMKTTTASVLFRSAINSLDDEQKDAVIHHRRVAPSLLKHAFVILTLYIFTLFLAILLLTVTEPETDLLPLVFEAFSAIATVGLSTGITGSLSLGGKVVIMVLMFIGRLGPLSIYLAFHKSQVKPGRHVTYPNANIIIG